MQAVVMRVATVAVRASRTVARALRLVPDVPHTSACVRLFFAGGESQGLSDDGWHGEGGALAPVGTPGVTSLEALPSIHRASLAAIASTRPGAAFPGCTTTRPVAPNFPGV